MAIAIKGKALKTQPGSTNHEWSLTNQKQGNLHIPATANQLNELGFITYMQPQVFFVINLH